MNSDKPADHATAANSEAVIQLWFSDPETQRLDLPQPKRWFMGGKELDDELSEKFGATLAQAKRGQLDHWHDSARQALALVVVLDQFNRNIHRGTADAFACDAKALSVCHLMLERRYDQELPITQRLFCYMPLEHDESVQSQTRSVALFEKLHDDAPSQLKDFTRRVLDSALEHKAIIDQFGRYPYRNAVLGRPSTTEEEQWITQGNKRFGQ